MKGYDSRMVTLDYHNYSSAPLQTQKYLSFFDLKDFGEQAERLAKENVLFSSFYINKIKLPNTSFSSESMLISTNSIFSFLFLNLFPETGLKLYLLVIFAKN